MGHGGPIRPGEDDQLEQTAEQTAMLLDDLDEPVPYRLTTRARRLVAPEQVPDLTIVPDGKPAGAADPSPVPADLDDPHDPRSARARALRRSGASVEAIADVLGVDPVAVRTWVSGMGATPHRHPVRRLRAVPTPIMGPHREDDDERTRRRQELAAERAAAANELGDRLSDPGFVRGLALVAASAELSEHGLLLTVMDPDVARVAMEWLVQRAGVDHRDVRVVLRVGALVGSDLVMHRWAQALGIDVAAITRSHWRGAPSDDAIEALLRVTDPHAAARIAGWRDVLLAGDMATPAHPDVGF